MLRSPYKSKHLRLICVRYIKFNYVFICRWGGGMLDGKKNWVRIWAIN